MPYFDLARVEYHRALDMLRTGPEGEQFVMRAMTVEYHAPARFDDEIEIDVRIARIGTSSVTYEFAAYLGGDVLAVKGTQTVVLLDLPQDRPGGGAGWGGGKIKALGGGGGEAEAAGGAGPP